jgi:hypothetical protein
MTSQHLEPRAPRAEQVEICPSCEQVAATGPVPQPDRARAVTGAQFAARVGSASAIVIAGLLVAPCPCFLARRTS